MQILNEIWNEKFWLSSKYYYYYYYYLYYCRSPKIWSPSPLGVMGYASQTWPKSIKFVRGEKEQQQWALHEDMYKEESRFLLFRNK